MNGSGMSRAAKKRAKKKNKNKTNESKSAQHSNEQPQSTKRKEQEDVDSHDDDDEKKKRNKKQKTRDRKQEPTKEDIPSNNSHHHQNEDDDEKDENPVDKAVQDVVARLDPAKILLHRPLGKDDETAKILNEDVAVGDLLKEITTRQRAKCLLQSIIGTGLPLEEFYSQYWEKEPLLVQADDDEKTRFDGLMSLSGIRRLLKDQPMSYGKDLNVTRYVESVDGVKRRLTLDQTSEGEFVMADARDVWANFDDGCTVRLLCPHQHNDTVHALLSTLETEWGCMVGANAYLTPPSEAQGFAPHYDDIEAFILQLEGRKRWKVYEPLSKAHVLPRRSSGDYTEQDLKNIEPVLDVVLGPGDLLYMPRGWIHQACTLPTSREHSLHLTVSAMQQWAWIDFLELLVPEALEAAASSETSTSLREGLPRRFLDYMGAIHDQPGDPEELKQLADRQKQENTDQNGTTNAETKKKKQQRESFLVEAKKRIMRVAKEALTMVDAACDQMGTRFLSDRLPPAMTAAESAMTSEKREGGGKVWPNTLCRLARPGIARLALEHDKAVLFHCVDNSRVFHGNPISGMEFEMDDAPALEMLLATEEPHWIMVQDLIHDDIEDKIGIAQALYDEGILAILPAEGTENSNN